MSSLSSISPSSGNLPRLSSIEIESKAQPITRFKITFPHMLSKAFFHIVSTDKPEKDLTKLDREALEWEIRDLTEEELEEAQSAIDTIKRQLPGMPATLHGGMESTILKNKIKILCSEYRRLERELEEAQRKLQQSKTSSELEGLKSQVNELQTKIAEAEKTSLSFQESAQKAMAQFQKMQGEKDRLESESTAYRLNKEAALTEANKQIASLKKDLKASDEIKKIKQSFEKQISELKAKVSKLQESADKAEKLGKEVKSRDVKIKDLEKQVKQRNEELKTKQEDLEKAKKNQKSEAELKELQNELAAAREKLKTSEEKYQSAIQQFQHIQELFQQLGTNIQEAFKTHQAPLPNHLSISSSVSNSSTSTAKVTPPLKNSGTSGTKRKIATDSSADKSKEPKEVSEAPKKKTRHLGKIEEVESETEYDLNNEPMSETDEESDQEPVSKSNHTARKAPANSTAPSPLTRRRTRSDARLIEEQATSSNGVYSRLRSGNKEKEKFPEDSLERSAKHRATEKMEELASIDIYNEYEVELEKLKARDEAYRATHLKDIEKISRLKNKKQQLQKENEKLQTEIKKLKEQLSQKK